MKIGQFLKEIRMKNGIKQKILAEKLKISANYLNLIENGKRLPGLFFIKDVSAVFDIPYSYLLLITIDPPDENHGELAKKYIKFKETIEKYCLRKVNNDK